MNNLFYKIFTFITMFLAFLFWAFAEQSSNTVSAESNMGYAIIYSILCGISMLAYIFCLLKIFK